MFLEVREATRLTVGIRNGPCQAKPDKVLLSSPGRPQICYPPVSAFQCWDLRHVATILGVDIHSNLQILSHQTFCQLSLTSTRHNHVSSMTPHTVPSSKKSPTSSKKGPILGYFL